MTTPKPGDRVRVMTSSGLPLVSFVSPDGSYLGRVYVTTGKGTVEILECCSPGEPHDVVEATIYCGHRVDGRDCSLPDGHNVDHVPYVVNPASAVKLIDRWLAKSSHPRTRDILLDWRNRWTFARDMRGTKGGES